MSNLWIPVPYDPQQLPWPVKAGKKMLWTIHIPAHGQWPAKSFVFSGSFVEGLGLFRFNREHCIIRDKDSGIDTGFYYHTVTAYMDCPPPYT